MEPRLPSENSELESWLVLGDSLSDGFRARDPKGIGSAWPAAACRIAGEHGRHLEMVNRARGGSRSVEVLRDLRESPDLARARRVSILVGANDLWRRYVPWEDHEPVDPDDFGRNLRRLVTICREASATEVFLSSPCTLHADPDHPWNRELETYRDVMRSVASRESVRYVPMGEEFVEAQRRHPEVKWTYDGVHPRPVGHERLALTWLAWALGLPACPVEEIPPRPRAHRLGHWP